MQMSEKKNKKARSNFSHYKALRIEKKFAHTKAK